MPAKASIPIPIIFHEFIPEPEEELLLALSLDCEGVASGVVLLVAEAELARLVEDSRDDAIPDEEAAVDPEETPELVVLVPVEEALLLAELVFDVSVLAAFVVVSVPLEVCFAC